MKIPFLDLKAQYKTIEDEIKEAINIVCESQSFILGDHVRIFEDRIQMYCDCNYAIGVSSGTDALLMSLMALDIKENDIVITTPYTFFATAGAIARVGAIPVFIDIDKDTFNISLQNLPKLIHKLLDYSYGFSRVKAMIPVHLFGQCADMTEINEFCERHKIKVIEDSAQALGSIHKNKKAGSIGDLSCFSFFPSKNLGAFGDGGMITTNDKTLYDKLIKLRSHGASPKYYHDMIGGNFRLDEIQAAILLVKMIYLDEWTKKRNYNANLYYDLIEDFDLLEHIKYPKIIQTNHIFNQYVITIRSNKRDELKSFLKSNDISTEIYYPVPLHLQKCFSYLDYKEGDFPNSEYASKHTLALPIYPELTDEMIYYTVRKIKEFFSK